MNNFTLLISKFLEQSELYAREKPIKGLIIFITILIFGFPTLDYLHKLVREFPYIAVGNNLISLYKNNFTYSDTFILFILILLISRIILIHLQIKLGKEIEDNFKSGLRKWSIPIGSGWNTTVSSGSTGRMLTVTMSDYPGLLKGAFSWYDYSFFFKAKIPKKSANPNVGVFIRARDSSNGVLLQIQQDRFIPYYVYNGSYITDSSQVTFLITKLPLESWVNFNIKVTGNKVLIKFEGQEINFTIKDYNFTFITKSSLFNSPNTSKLQIESEEHKKLLDVWLEKFKKFNEVQASPASDQDELAKAQNEKDEAWKTFNDKVQNYETVNLEYNSGSVGFKQMNSEITYFREVKLEKID